jgi:hypothetical protein
LLGTKSCSGIKRLLPGFPLAGRSAREAPQIDYSSCDSQGRRGRKPVKPVRRRPPPPA